MFILLWALCSVVFPACAGMFLSVIDPTLSPQCFPRVRGDVPSKKPGFSGKNRFSPRARGCSTQKPCKLAGQSVFPACAGMFRSGAIFRCFSVSFPRVRGDVPLFSRHSAPRRLFSPRARGCSRDWLLELPRGNVFPACAGMFRYTFPNKKGSASFPRVRGDVPFPRSARPL